MFSWRWHFGRELDSAQAITPHRPGHALACTVYTSRELSTCIMQEPSDEIRTERAIFTPLIKPKCVPWYHTIGICASASSLLHNYWIHINISLQVKPPACEFSSLNKWMLINDLISAMAPHHTADDKCGDGRLWGTTCGFPPCLLLPEGGKKSIKAERGCYRDLAEELSQKREEVVKVVQGNCVPPCNGATRRLVCVCRSMDTHTLWWSIFRAWGSTQR